MPTLHSAPPASEWLVSNDELPPVWPDPEAFKKRLMAHK